MKPRLPLLLAAALAAWLPAGCRRAASGPESAGVVPPSARTATPSNSPAMKDAVIKTEAQWRAQLTPEQFRVLRQKGTERAFTGAYWNHHEPGVYTCAGCGLKLFRSDDKFDSGCGWPSFTQPLRPEHVATQPDHSLGMNRTEVLCPRCGGHLGHVFPDGPAPTGLRYCINSAALRFEKTPPAAEPDPKTRP